MKEILRKKGISLSPKVYFIDALGAMAFGLFASLLINRDYYQFHRQDF